MTSTTHPLDHLVLPTASLAVARARLTSLGFIVAPTGIHPFGTENCCVFFADGTYLEPLAIGDGQTAARAIVDGNVFVARDRLYRASLGNEGFSAVVLGTGDADADHARYVSAGLSAGNGVSFSRAVTDAAGKSDMASLKRGLASGSGATDAFLFACERINAPKIDRTALQAHANGVTGIVEIVAVSDAPSAQAHLIETATGLEQGSGTAFGLPNAVISVLDPGAFTARFSLAAGEPSDLRFAAVIFSVRSVDVTARLLQQFVGNLEANILGPAG